jgi:N-hydroxyarylamine O-acetyltransferase
VDRHVDPDLRDRVLERFGFGDLPTIDEAGVTALYRAWCRHVPFDNVRKLIALHGDGPAGPLPTMDATDLLETWLRHGAGGTCWPSSNALHALVDACGFEVRQVAASMFDQGVPTHATTIVTVDGRERLLDSSMLTDRPVPLDRHVATMLDDPVFGTRAEPVEEGWLLTFSMAASDDTLPCRTITPDAVSTAFCAERYEASRVASPFNVSVTARRNDAGGLVSYTNGSRVRRSPTRVDAEPCVGEALAAALVAEIGLSDEIVAHLMRVLPPAP